jgi:sarcosine oxidase subunit beta
MTNTFDAVIIGAGIMGCSTAFQLSRRGLKVAVIEKSNIGAGSTGTSSAIIRQHYSNETTARMALHSLRVFQKFREEVGEECGFTQTGFLVLIPEGDLQGLHENVALQKRIGILTEILPRDEVRARWPDFELGDIVEAAYEKEAGYADPNLTLNGYVSAAKSLGARYFVDTEVVGVRVGSGRVAGVDTTAGAFDAPAVLNCAGPWGSRVAELMGVEAPINSCRVQVSLFRRPEGHQSQHPVVADFVNAVYWRPETGGLTLIGLIDPGEEKAVVDPDRFNTYVDKGFIIDSGERWVRRYPSMVDAESTGGFASLYAITPDWHPIIDELGDGSGLFICAGFSGHGFKLGPAVGLMAADMVLGKSTPGMDRHLFRLRRFAENDPVKGQYDYSIVG